MNLESKVPSVQELEDHFRAQAKWKGPPPGYWIVDQKGKGEHVEPKIELVSPIAQELKRAESQVKQMKRKGQPMPNEPIVVKLKAQKLSREARPSTKNNRKSKKKPWEKYK